MSSLKVKVKNFLKYKVLASMPDFFFVALYRLVMHPKAQSDREAIASQWERYFKDESDRIVRTKKELLFKNPIVVAMAGLPQTGKTAVADVVSSEIGLFRLNSNQVRGWLIDAGRDYRNFDALILSMLEEILKKLHNPILDSDNMNLLKRAFIEAVARNVNATTRIKYIGVDVDFTVWESRLDTTVFNIHRMYADGIRRSDKTYKDVNVRIPTERIIKCVKEEYNRQAMGRAEMAETIYISSSIYNGNSKEHLKKEARGAAQALVDLFGDATIER